MAENDERPASPEADATPTETIEQPAAAPVPAAATPAPAATRFRDTLWTFKAVVAVAVATFLIGGLGGALVVAAADDDGPDRVRVGWMGGPGDERGPGYFRGPDRFQGPDKFYGPGDDGPKWRWDGDRPELTPPSPRTTPSPSAPESGSTG